MTASRVEKLSVLGIECCWRSLVQSAFLAFLNKAQLAAVASAASSTWCLVADLQVTVWHRGSERTAPVCSQSPVPSPSETKGRALALDLWGWTDSLPGRPFCLKRFWRCAKLTGVVIYIQCGSFRTSLVASGTAVRVPSCSVSRLRRSHPHSPVAKKVHAILLKPHLATSSHVLRISDLESPSHESHGLSCPYGGVL